MSEGYVYTSATDANDLLNQIVSQAAIHGWTQHMLTGLGGSGRRGHISKGGVVLNFASVVSPSNLGSSTAWQTYLNLIIPPADQYQATTSYSWSYSASSIWYQPDALCINASTGFNSDVNWYRQPGGPTQSDTLLNQGRFDVIRSKGAIGKVYMFFFEDPVGIIVITEPRPGEFYWLTGGMLKKDYEFTGGQFYGASMADSSIVSGANPAAFGAVKTRCPEADVVRTRGNGWGGSYTTAPSRNYGSSGVPDGERVPGYWVYIPTSTPSLWSEVVANGYDEASGRLWIQPPYVYAERPGPTKSYLGVLPGVMYSTVQSFVGADIVTIGGQEYMIFPFNYRPSPYDKTVGNVAAAALYWTRAAVYGSGLAIRKPS